MTIVKQSAESINITHFLGLSQHLLSFCPPLPSLLQLGVKIRAKTSCEKEDTNHVSYKHKWKFSILKRIMRGDASL